MVPLSFALEQSYSLTIIASYGIISLIMYRGELLPIPGEQGLLSAHFDGAKVDMRVTDAAKASLREAGGTVLRPIQQDSLFVLFGEISYVRGGWKVTPRFFDLANPRKPYIGREITELIGRLNGLHGEKYMLFGEQSGQLDATVSSMDIQGQADMTGLSRFAASGEWHVYENIPAGTQIALFNERPRQLFTLRETVPAANIIDRLTRIDQIIAGLHQ